MSIKLIHGSCADQEVDAVVNAANKNLISGGGICGVIYKKAGYQELNDACSKIKTPLNDGDAVITESFNMNNCKYIIHAVGPNFSITPDAIDSLFKAYYNSLLVLKDNNLKVIAFPLISSGIFGGNLERPGEVSARECLKAYNKFNEDYDYDLDVKLCAFSEKELKEVENIIK